MKNVFLTVLILIFAPLVVVAEAKVIEPKEYGVFMATFDWETRQLTGEIGPYRDMARPMRQIEECWAILHKMYGKAPDRSEWKGFERPSGEMFYMVQTQTIDGVGGANTYCKEI